MGGGAASCRRPTPINKRKHDDSGASDGYVAAGGPGLTGPTDTEGIKAYQAAGGSQ